MAVWCGWRGVDWQVGRRGDDELIGGDGRDWLFGRFGDDHLQGGAGDDLLVGGWGDDLLTGDDGDDWLLAGRGDDSAAGGEGADRLRGGWGDDDLAGGGGNDLIFGGRGDDRFTYGGGDGHDVVRGGRGDDLLLLESVGAGWALDLRRGEVLAEEAGWLDLSRGAVGTLTFADGGSIRFRGVEQIEIVQDNSAPSILGLSADSVDEHAAAGTVVGMVSAHDPDAGDRLSYHLTDDADGRFAIDAVTGEVSVAGGALLDHASDDAHAIEVQVVDQQGMADTAAFSITVMLDNAGDDDFTGTAGDDVLDGGEGDDRLLGEGGDDQLIGGAGDDELDGGEGDDVLDGGEGDDMINGWYGDDQLDGGAGDDLMFGYYGDDLLSGGGGADQLHGGADDDTIEGDDDDDRLFGNTGDDHLDGGAGDDLLYGSLGDDVIDGGTGDDILSGGSGADRFVLAGADPGVDTITDFGSGDVLAIGALLDGFAAGQETLFASLIDDGTDTTVQVDRNGAVDGATNETVAVLAGFSGSSLADLVADGQIDFS